MTVKELIENYEEHNRNGKYFSRGNLLFFGERISEMEVMGLRKITDRDGVERQVWVLKAFAENCPKNMCPVHYTYFDADTFEEVDPEWRTEL